MEVWRAEVIEGRRPKVLDGANVAAALVVHLVAFLGLYVFAVFHGLFDKPEEVIPIDLTVVVNENLDGKENEPPPLQKPDPPKPKPKPEPPKPKPKPKEPEKPKELEKIVTNIVQKVEKKQEKKEEKKQEKKEEKKPEPPKKTAKELREERLKQMRESAKTVSKPVTIEVKNAPSGDGRTAKSTLNDPKKILELLNKGYKPGTSDQIAKSEMERCQSLVKMAIKDRWDKLAPKIGNNGTVLLSVQFNSSGGLINVRLAKSCGDRLSDDAALSVARSVSAIPGLSDEFKSKFRSEALTIRYYVSNK